MLTALRILYLLPKQQLAHAIANIVSKSLHSNIAVIDIFPNKALLLPKAVSKADKLTQVFDPIKGLLAIFESKICVVIERI